MRIKSTLDRSILESRSLPAPFARGRWCGPLWGTLAGAFVLCWCGCWLPEGGADSPPTQPGARGPSNRLARETSPYLLAHAHNPVDWYPWGAEALDKARQEGKPIFLSIGYSSCHWCHVMEKLVFSNPEIARYMNEHFVNVKVDREERPDLDDIYMTALQIYFQAIGSQQTGGWPLSIFLTPDGRPLGGGTYFPPRDEEGRTGFPALMKKVADSWRDNRKQMETNADILADGVRKASRPRAALKAVALERSLIAPAIKSLQAGYDAEYGGFGFDKRSPDRPKFPVPTKLALLQYEAKRPDGDALAKMLRHTLDRMAAGGIYDQVGGGFHRYSTDRYWRVPHFEKMLYDNAQLVDVYAEAYRHTRQPDYRAVAEGTIAFVFREMTDPRGGFYSALDADSDGVEGLYYVWTDDQLAAVLTPDERAVCRVVYGSGGPPNFEIGHVLEQRLTIDEAAGQLSRSALQLERDLTAIKRKLLTARQERRAPARDDKILVSWNGLMIRALAHAGVTFEKPEYIAAAAKAAEFILAEMRDEKGRLHRTYRAGQARLDGYLDDYAFLIDGLLALQLATADEKWGRAAQRLTDLQVELFWDEAGKGCFYTSRDHEKLLARTKAASDSVLPSGNSVTVRNLLRLASMTNEAKYRDRAREALELFIPAMEEHPGGLTNMTLALAEYVDTAASSSVKGETGRARVAIAPDSEILLAKGNEKPPAEKVSPARSVPGKAAKSNEVVTGEAFLSVERLPPGGTCKVLVQLQIAKGWHIHTNPAGDEFDQATELTVTSDLGTQLTRIKYPVGESVARDADEPPALQYSGKVAIQGLLEIPADAASKKDELTIEVTYQACNDTKCLAPKTLKIQVPVKVAAKGDPIKSINEKLFAPPPKKPGERGNAAP